MPKSLFSLVLLGFTTFVFAQKSQQENLELRKAKIQKEIIDNEKKLLTVKKKEKTAVEVMDLQTKKIKLKETLIQTTEKQTQLLSNDMQANELKIDRLDNELNLLKVDYAEMILKSYKSRSEESRAMFILSSSSFLQAYKRLQYMKQYASYRKVQGEEIKNKTKELEGYNEKISVQKTEKQKLLEENQKEKAELEKEKQVQQEIAKSIKKDKKQIIAEIKKKQQETRAIDNQIQKLIKAAIAAANKKTAEANRKTAEVNRKTAPNSPKTVSKETSNAASKAIETSTKIVLTSEGQLIANNFKANKGKLPWPVEKGFVSLAYGDQPHPIYKTLIVHNSGVEITTDQGANARAVFGGEVISVMILSPVNKAVMIQHGDYFTVYQNLSSVSVSKGDKVSIKETIGRIRTNGDTGKTVLKFTISQNTTYNNPASWLFNM